jgi:hypothetical protein
MTLTNYGMNLIENCNEPGDIPHSHNDPCGKHSGHEAFDCPMIVTDVPYELTSDLVVVVDMRDDELDSL